MKRKLLAILTSALLLCAMLPLCAMSVSAETASGTAGACTWTLEDTHLTISGNGEMPNHDYESERFPWREWREIVTEVTICDGVTTIGSGAFEGFHAMTSVSIPDSVTSIGDEAFYECYKLISIVIPEGVTYLGQHALGRCGSLTTVTLPRSLTRMGDPVYGDSFGDLALSDIYYGGNESDWEELTKNLKFEDALRNIHKIHFTDVPVEDEEVDTPDADEKVDNTEKPQKDSNKDEKDTEDKDDGDGSKSNTFLYIGIGAGVLIIAIVLVLIVSKKKKN